jgi:hypothetical protein
VAVYIVFKEQCPVPENLVYYEYDLGDALDLMENLSSDGTEWGVAEVIPMDSWYGKLLRFLHMRSK